MPSAIGLVMAVQPPDAAHTSASSTNLQNVAEFVRIRLSCGKGSRILTNSATFLWNVFIAYSFGGPTVIVVIRARGGVGTASGSLGGGVTLTPVIRAVVGST